MRTYLDPDISSEEIKKWNHITKSIEPVRVTKGGHILKGTSFVEYVERTIEGNRKAEKDKKYRIIDENYIDVNWPGRKAKGSWDEILKLLSTPWPEATELINWYVEEVSRYPLPEPHSIKQEALHTRRWSLVFLTRIHLNIMAAQRIPFTKEHDDDRLGVEAQ